MVIHTLKPKVIVIGAGIGGIAVAARLARRGCEVTVVEKNEQPGGRCGRMKVEGYTFDTGATFFLMPGLYQETFAALGERMEDHLDLRRVDPTYHLYFPDGSGLLLSPDMRLMKSQLEEIEPGSFHHLLAYLAQAGGHYLLSEPNLVERDFRRLGEFINPRMILLFLRLRSLTRHTSYARHFFKDPRLLSAFTFQDMYMGLSPYESPATYSLMQFTELVDGLYYPMGGMYRVAEVLTSLAEKQGVKFMYQAPVGQILIEGDRARGVALQDGRRLSAEAVVANADLSYVYQNLLPEEDMARRLDHKEYGCSTIMFYWGLDSQYPRLGPHNLFLNSDYRSSFEDIFKAKSMPSTPTFYIHAPGRFDPSLAPAGCESLYAAVPVGHIDSRNPQDWPALQAQARSYILHRLNELGVADLEPHIRVEKSFLPTDWRDRYNLTRGSTHGLSHKLTQMAYFRPHNRHSRYHNLYFAGASTRPGTGIPMVLVSARLASERLLQDLELSHPKLV